MITDMADLEPALEQYDPAIILVGPLLSLSINSNFRYIYLAGEGAKVYNPLSLGFIDDESDAERQRAEIIDKLKARFAEVVTFGDHAEMARVVEGRWPSEETARLLGAVEFAANAEQAKSAGDTGFSKVEPGLPDQQPGRLLGTADHPIFAAIQPDEFVNRVSAAAPTPDDFLASEQPLRFGLEPGEGTAAIGSAMSKLVARESTRLDRDDNPQTEATFASLLAAEPIGDYSDEINAEQVAVADESAAAPWPKLPLATFVVTPSAMPTAATGRDRSNNGHRDDRLSLISSLKAARQSDSAEAELDELTVPPALGAGGSISALLQIAASAAAIALALVLVLPFFWRDSEKPVSGDTVAAESVSKSTSGNRQSSAAVPTISPYQVADADRSTPREQTSIATAPVAALSLAAPPSIGTTPSPVTDPQAATTNAAEVAMLVTLGRQSLQSGDLQPTQPSPQRMAEPTAPVIAAPASSSRGHNNAPGTAIMPPLNKPADSEQQPIRQTDAPTVAAPNSEPSRPEELADRGTVPVITGQRTPANEGSAPKHLDPGEATALVNRGIELLKSGDIASARLCFQRPAEAGNAEAALALGSTYDPFVLSKLGAVGVQPDIAVAREWYEKAIKLGSDTAARQLAKLAKTGQ
jgi:hypothetical protein